ncbi:MAG TPA: hypothetical protein EYQ49_08030 [Acidimicrobiia bacterium]|jgi:hypothetical protein|nr:hypothetical protein [Acidimicrobiia bacterium]
MTTGGNEVGIFAFEGDWTPSDLRDKSSARPILELLYKVDAERPFIHRRIGTREELDHYVDKWLGQNHDVYKVGYFAFHGSPKTIWLNDHEEDDAVSLKELADIIGPRASGRVIHFSTCNTLRVPDKELDNFLKTTKAQAVVGYTKTVGWIESTAFEILLLDVLCRYQRMKPASKALQKNYPALTSRLGLVFHTR